MGGFGSGLHKSKRGRTATLVPCPYCGETVPLAQAGRKGHAGCTRVRRRLPSRRRQKRPKEEIAAGLVRGEHGEMILPLTREQIAERIGAMSAGAFGRMARRLILRRRAKSKELRRAG
jgi:hypothetical protein